MVVHLSLMILLTFICLLPNFNKKIRPNFVLTLSFIITWGYTAFRFDYGPDYMNYLNAFNGDIMFNANEFLFYEIMSLFPSFSLFIIALSTVLCITFFFFFKEYIPSKQYWFAILIFYLNINFLINNLSALRSGMVVYSLIFAVFLFYKKKYLIALFLIVITSFIHISILPLLSLPIIIYFLTKINSFVLYVLFFLFWILGSTLSLHLVEYMFSISEIFENSYRIYADNIQNNVNAFIFNIVYVLISFIIIYHRKYFKSKKDVIIFALSLIYISVILSRIDVAGRYQMYLISFFLAAIIRIINVAKNPYRLFVGIVFFIISALSLWNLYQQSYAGTFKVYKTIFS